MEKALDREVTNNWIYRMSYANTAKRDFPSHLNETSMKWKEN